MFYSSAVCYPFSCLDWQGKNIRWIIKWIEQAEWAFDDKSYKYILLFPSPSNSNLNSGISLSVPTAYPPHSWLRSWVLTINTNHVVGINLKLQIWQGGKTNRYKVYPNHLKGTEKLHWHKSQPIFSDVSQTEWYKPFDFPTGIYSFAM